jgi:uncharacterized protein DUF992
MFDVKIVVEDVMTSTRSAPFISRFKLIAGPEAKPHKPGSPANGHRTKPGDQSLGPSLAIPEVVEKHFNDPRPSLQVRHDDDGQPEYFLNLDNAYLVTELTRTKDEEKPLVKFWFKYGLLLCALGMLKEQQDKQLKQEKLEKQEKEDMLTGTYIGATAQATAVAGLGANALVGGSNHSVALQPLSVQGQVGLNAAGGIGALELHYAQ